MDRNIPDEVLMEEYAKGDIGAFESLVDRHRGPLFGYLCRMLGNRQQAEDAFQEVFIRVINSSGRYTRRAKFTTWFYKIAHNVCVDMLRRESYRKTESLFEPVSETHNRARLHDILPSSNPGPAELLARRQVSDALKKCVARLSADQREVFVLRQYQGLSFQEIARATRASESTVKSRMRYALNNLRAMLLKEHITEGVSHS
ncbi:MAG: RNA polymerase sigma factor [Candidatus Abyssubacteria bacterium]